MLQSSKSVTIFQFAHLKVAGHSREVSGLASGSGGQLTGATCSPVTLLTQIKLRV